MMKIVSLLFATLLTHAIAHFKSTEPTSVYDFTLKTIDGETFTLEKYKGKKILIVTTASKSGWTRKLEDLEKLYEANKDKLVIIGIPTNSFGNQESGTNAEIKDFYQKAYHVTFPLTEKMSCLGDDMHPLFKYLTSVGERDLTGNNKKYSNKSFLPPLSGKIYWNFENFFIDESGHLEWRFRSCASLNYYDCGLNYTLTADMFLTN